MRREIFKEQIGENEFLVGRVTYEKGGANYFSGQSDPRGYYLNVHPETHKDGFVSFILFTGVKAFLKPAKRFSQKEFESIVPDPALVEKVKAAVLAKKAAKAEREVA